MCMCTRVCLVPFLVNVPPPQKASELQVCEDLQERSVVLVGQRGTRQCAGAPGTPAGSAQHQQRRRARALPGARAACAPAAGEDHIRFCNVRSTSHSCNWLVHIGPSPWEGPPNFCRAPQCLASFFFIHLSAGTEISVRWRYAGPFGPLSARTFAGAGHPTSNRWLSRCKLQACTVTIPIFALASLG